MIDPSTTLNEMKALQMSWQHSAQAEKIPDDILLIVRCLGKVARINRRDTRVFSQPYQFGIVNILQWEGDSTYSTQNKRFEYNLKIVVTVTDKPEQFYTEGMTVMKWEIGSRPIRGENIFIPGQWVEALKKNLRKAQDIQNSWNNQQLEREIEALTKTLLIGREI